MPVNCRSSTNVAIPRTLSRASSRTGDCPTLENLLSSISLPRHGRRLRDRFDDTDVPGAAAQVAAQRFADLGPRRTRIAIEERDRRDQHAGRAEAALDGAFVDERLLERVQLLAAGQPFDRDHVAAVGFECENEE